MASTFSLLNRTRSSLPASRLLFSSIAEYVLGTEYELSVVFVTAKEMRSINLKTRNKDKATNILSFPLDKKSGEIFICPLYAKKEAHLFDRSYENYIGFLFIHGLIHLKGFDHGSKMENEEKKVRKHFSI
jgi:probable rRNA maturation factor